MEEFFTSLAILATLATFGTGALLWRRCLRRVKQAGQEAPGLREELTKRQRELEVIYQVSQVAITHPDLETMLSAIGAQMEEIFGVSSAFIAIYNPKQQLIYTSYWTINKERVYAEPMPYPQGLTTILLKTGKPLLLEKDVQIVAPQLGAELTFAEKYGCPKTWLGVPILIKQEAIGAMSIQNYEKEYAFGEEDVRLLQTIAASVGISIQNAWLREATRLELDSRKQAEAQARHRAEQMNAINLIGRAITSGLELDSVLTSLRVQCQQIAPQIDIFTVALYDERTETFRFAQFYDDGVQLTEKPRHIQQREGGVTAEVIRTMKTIYLPDTQNREAKRTHTILHHGKKHARAYLGIPLQMGQKIIGVLSCQSYQPHSFHAEQIDMLETIALQAAIAVENARLYEQTRQRMQELEGLYEVSLALGSNLNLQNVMEKLFQKCHEIFPLDVFYIALYDEETHIISHPLFWDAGKFCQTAARDIRDSPGLSGEVILSRRTLHIPDVLAPNAGDSLQIFRLGGSPSRCYLGAPMIARQNIVGVISIQTYQPNTYTPEHIRLLETIARQAALALENSRLYQTAQEELDKRKNSLQNLKTQLTEVEAAQDTLREQAIRDPLTNLYNRRYLNEHIKTLLQDSINQQKPLCVLMLDIDHFKKLNDEYTHLAGDQLLQALAEMLRASTRPGDITCRYGGEEFILLLPETTLEIATRRAEEIRQRMQETRAQFNEHSLSATISIGVTGYPYHSDNAPDLILQADQALYAAKSAGRNRVICWSPSISA
jgi:diguanylate cyclase (GGDEF)-like protein